MVNCLWFIPKRIYKNTILKDLEKIWYMVFTCLYAIGSVYMRELSYNTILGFLIISFVIETLLTLKLYIDIREALIFVGFLSYYLIMRSEHPFQVPFIFLLSYMVMKQFVLNGGKLYKRRIFQFFIIVGICLCLFGFLEAMSSYYRPVRAYNEINTHYRDGYSKHFWNNSIKYNITHLTIYFIPVISLVVYSFANIKSNPFISIITIILSSIVYGISFYIDLRNPVIISIIASAVAIVIFFIKNIKNKITVKIYVLLIEFLIVISSMFFLIWNFYLSDKLVSAVTKSVDRDGGIIGNIRFKWQLEVLSKLLNQPMGGIQISDCELNMAHNFWIDVAKDAGVIPFIILIAFLIISCIDALILVKNCKHGDNNSIFLPMIFLSYTLYNIIEPTVYTVLMYLPLYYMTSAAMRAVNIREKRSRRRKDRERLRHEES